jgi:hypothetical protein
MASAPRRSTDTRRPARLAPLMGLLVAATMLTGCRPDTARVTFRPAPGATYQYVVDVTAETVTALEGESPRRQRQQVRLVEEQTVLERDTSAGDGGVRVRVYVGEPGATAQSFVVRFDEAAQLRAIETAEDAPADLASAVGVPEIFPGAVARPDRRVGPGVRWSTTRRVTLAGTSAPSTMRTRGRFVEFAVDGDRRLARIESTTELPLRSDTPSLALRGTETIRQEVTYDVSDGSVHEATATTTGRFTITVQPPAGSRAEPVDGTLVLTVRSVTRRQR